MEPTFQTSFIPKKPIVTDQGGNSSFNVVRETNIFSVVSTILFLVTLLVSGALFGYKIILNKQIAKFDAEIISAQESFQLEKIKELINANDRIASSKILLEQHVTLSKLLYLFQDLTVKRVRIQKLTYSTKSGAPTVSISGQALNYNALADQANIFSKNDYLKNGQFSNFVLENNGNVKADYVATIDTSLVSYKKAIDSTQPQTNPVQNSVPSQATSTSQ